MTPALIEAAAKAIYQQRNGHGCTPWEKINTQHREPYRKDVRAVLSAIEAAGLAVVPVDAAHVAETLNENVFEDHAIRYSAMIATGKL